MAKFFVTRGGPSLDETVEADSCRITEVGALVFTVTEPAGAAPGVRTYDRIVKGFAPGRWAEVERLGHVCAALPRHVHNAAGEPVYVEPPL